MAISPEDLLRQLQNAINLHDLEAFVACVAPDYQSEQPVHPARAFTGRDQVRKNWAGIFASVADLRADVVRSITSSDTVWTEWRWLGTRQDGEPFDMRGVTIFGLRDDQFAWGRLYMEETDTEGSGIDETVQQLTGES